MTQCHDQSPNNSSTPRTRSLKTVITVLIVVISMVVAGLFANLRDVGVEDSSVKAPLGKAVSIANGQSFVAEHVRIGRYAITRKDYSQSYRISHGRMVAVSVKVATSRKQTIGGMHCGLRTIKGGWILSSEVTRISTPGSGFELTQDLLFEIAAEQLAGAQLDCNPVSLIVFHDVAPLIDLNITQAMVNDTSDATITLVQDSIRALP